MADVKWIKITTDIFSDEKILLIEQMPDADSLLVIWFKLLCMAGKENNYGVFMMRNRMPYTDEMLATIFRRPLNTVRLALSTFEAFGMIEIEDEIICIPNWEKHQNIDGLEKVREQNRLRKQKQRERQKQLLLTDDSEGNVTSRDSHATDKNRIDKNRLEEYKKDVSASIESEKPAPAKNKPAKHKYGEYNNVLLTDTEYENLANTFGIELRDRAINFLDAYIEEKGYKSKSHNLAIRRWVIDAVKEKQGKQSVRKEPIPKWMPKNQNNYDFEALENDLVANGSDDWKAEAEALQKELREKY